MQIIRLFLAAPHRLPFLTGTTGIAGLALWWTAYLSALFFDSPLPAQTELPGTLLHGPVMIYAAFAPFIFGFLLTVFPRWMSQADLTAMQFGPVAGLLFFGVLLIIAGIWSGTDSAILIGFVLLAGSWALAIVVLVAVLRRHGRSEAPPCWHAWSALLGVVAGLVGAILAAGFVANGDALLMVYANRLGISGFLLPVFLTVAHRMIPFFAGNVVEHYVRWRPDGLLAIIWVLLVIRIASELLGNSTGTFLANGGLACVTALMCWKWWPRSPAPGLLKVLIWGFAWAPIGFALAAFDNATGVLGRGPDHALLVGFAGSLLVAMVTRVTQGHSGRQLTMPFAAWLAFWAIQLAAICRILAAIRFEEGAALLAAAAVFALGLLPWLLRNFAIYLLPRRDGKPG